jgi:hypothetical protein
MPAKAGIQFFGGRGRASGFRFRTVRVSGDNEGWMKIQWHVTEQPAILGIDPSPAGERRRGRQPPVEAQAALSEQASPATLWNR